MAKLEIPIKVDIYKIEELIDQLKHLQTYKLDAGDEMTLVDRDDVVEIIADHVKAEVSPPDQRWIPCSVRRPTEERDYIVSIDYGDEQHISTDMFIIPEKGDPFWLVSDCVVAWMEEPKPYRQVTGKLNPDNDTH